MKCVWKSIWVNTQTVNGKKITPIVLEWQTTLKIDAPRWWHIRYDFGIYSRYTKSFYDEKKPSTATAFLYLGILMEKNEEISTLFQENWLRGFEVSESSGSYEDEELGIISEKIETIS